MGGPCAGIGLRSRRLIDRYRAEDPWRPSENVGLRNILAVSVELAKSARPENISKSYVSRILRVALLAPDIIEAIVAGRADQSLMLERLERPLRSSWEEQRRLLSAHTS